VEKIDASSSAAKNIQIELGSIKSGQKSHCAKFSWRKVIEWRKLPSRTCALGANNIAITRARVGRPSRNRACSYLRGSKSLARRHCELASLFRGSMVGLEAPLSTLRLAPRYALRMTRGQSGLLFLSYQRLSLFTLCRSPGALAYQPRRIPEARRLSHRPLSQRKARRTLPR
jgi:hypothetical protein